MRQIAGPNHGCPATETQIDMDFEFLILHVGIPSVLAAKIGKNEEGAKIKKGSDQRSFPFL